MEEKKEEKRRWIDDPKKFIGVINIIILVLLALFGIGICLQYILMSPRPTIGFIFAVVGSTVLLFILCVSGIYGARTFKAKVVLFVFDFVLLLIICAFTGSAYLAAVYCVLLTQIYLNIDDFKTQFIIFAACCVAFVVTCVTGWFLNNMRAITDEEIVEIVSGAVVGLIIIAIHFVVATFLIKFYRTNLKLTAALQEADERKAELEKAYEELSETAVFQERNRIARDIHDNAGHSMTSVIMQTEAAKLLIDTDPEQAKQKIISANMQARSALEQMRESVHLLAGRNTSRSLKEDLEEILAQTMDGTGVNIRADIEDLTISPEERRFVSNCLKECLTNGIRHGGATAFYVEFSEKEGEITLTVSDNGSGLPADYKEGFGIKGMREKATAYGGGVVLRSEKDDGLEINITFKKDGKNND